VINQNKIKKTKEALNLKLIPNPDILAAVAALSNAPITVGFAAETENLLNNARHKLTTKGIDIIAANLVGENVGFDVENNSLELFTKHGEQIKLAEKNKSALAYDLMACIFSYLQSVGDRHACSVDG
jgi:phosphopantothenoylcysteine decarboxylase/phosphopantothenate--cysteine ligase